jgi:hypothetical protein
MRAPPARSRETPRAIRRTSVREYGLQGFETRERAAVRMDAAALAAYAESYATVPEGDDRPILVTVELDGGVLRMSVPRMGWDRRVLRASAPNRFFFLQNPGELAFRRNASGAVTSATLTGQGRPIRLVRQ